MTAMVPVEELRPGDELVLPLGRTVLVERVDRFPDGTLVVRWHAGPYYRPPHPLAGQREHLGSLVPSLRRLRSRFTVGGPRSGWTARSSGR